MFRGQGRLDHTIVEVVWDNGLLEPSWLHARAEAHISMLRNAGVVEVSQACQAVPVDLGNDLFAVYLLNRLLERFQVTEGHVVSLIASPGVVY